MSANNYAKLDDYGLRYLPVHLAESDEVAELFALMNTDFCEALRAATKTDLLFTGHLSLARSVAFKQGRNQLPEAFRMMFMEVKLRSAVDSISPETLMLMARVGEIQRSLDMVELIRVREVKAVAIVLILRALAERGGQIDHSWVDRIRGIAETVVFGEEGIALLNAIADTYCLIGDTRQAILSLDQAKSIAINELVDPVQSANLAPIAYGYLHAGAFAKALDTAMLDNVRVDATPVFVAIANTARERGDLAIAQRALEQGAAIPDWVSGDHGLDANDVFALAAEARKLKNIPLTQQLTKKGRKVANDMRGGGLTALALQAAKEGNKATTKKLLDEAKKKAAKEFSGDWRAEAWLKIARVAHTLGDTKTRDDAMLKSEQAALEDDLWSVHQTLAELAKMYAEIGFPERGVEAIRPHISRGLRMSAEYEQDEVFRLVLLQAELNTEQALDRLRALDEQSRAGKFPAALQPDLGMALARAGDEDRARQILQRLEHAVPIQNIGSDPAKALVLDSLIAEVQSIPELRRFAEIWLNEAAALIGLKVRSRRSQEQSASVGTLEWVASTMITTRLAEQSPTQDPKQECISTLTLAPTPNNGSPGQLLKDVLSEEAGMGKAIGNIGVSLANRLVQAARGFLTSGDVAHAIDAVREIEYWRLLFHIQVSPMDSEEEGTHQSLFDVSRLHAGALIAIADAAKERGSSAGRFFEDALDDVRRIPYRSVRFVARVGIASHLFLDENELLPMSQKFLVLALQESREEFLATVPAWMPVLSRLGGSEFPLSLYQLLPLLGPPPAEMQLPRITPQRDIGGLFRTFDLVGSG